MTQRGYDYTEAVPHTRAFGFHGSLSFYRFLLVFTSVFTSFYLYSLRISIR
jgi:hypothetical protein